MPECRMLKDIMPSAFEGRGIFSAFDCPVWEYDFDSADLDLYFITAYGEKWGSPFLSYFDGPAGISDADMKRVAATIYRMYKSQWEHLYKANKAEYNPIHNTDVEERETINKVGNENSLEGSSTAATTETMGASDTNGGSTMTHDVAGFNSSSYVNDSKDIGTNNADTAARSANTAGSEGESTSVKNYADDHERVLKRAGNIGVQTSAQLISGELSLWQWNFIKGVMSDICETIALSVY